MKWITMAAALAVLPLSARAQQAPTNLNEATVVQLQSMMASGQLTSVALTNYYIKRIIALDQNGPGVNSVIELNPDGLAIAKNFDAMRANGKLLGPLHGIPVLLKDNIDTGDKMQTSAGSFALVGRPAVRDSTVAANLRAGGAVILGKTNLSEWANFRSFGSISGWSGRGGQTNNPYGINRNPCGSSSGSGAAASANFAAVSFGSETDGSIVCPGNANGVAAIKPTVGLTSRAGVVPISHIQDTVGPHCRALADCAAALGAAQSRASDGRDPATGGVPLGWRNRFTRPTNIPTDYTQFIKADGLRGARIGVSRAGLAGSGPVRCRFERQFLVQHRARSRSGGRREHGPGAPRQPPRRDRLGHRQPGLGHGPALRRPLHLRHLGAGCGSWISHRAGAFGQRLRHPHRRQLLRHRLQRANVDQAGLRIRGCHSGACEEPAHLPGHHPRHQHRGHNADTAQARSAPRQLPEGPHDAAPPLAPRKRSGRSRYSLRAISLRNQRCFWWTWTRRVKRSAVPMSPAFEATSASWCSEAITLSCAPMASSTICFTLRSPEEGGTNEVGRYAAGSASGLPSTIRARSANSSM